MPMENVIHYFKSKPTTNIRISQPVRLIINCMTFLTTFLTILLHQLRIFGDGWMVLVSFASQEKVLMMRSYKDILSTLISNKITLLLRLSFSLVLASKRQMTVLANSKKCSNQIPKPKTPTNRIQCGTLNTNLPYKNSRIRILPPHSNTSNPKWPATVTNVKSTKTCLNKKSLSSFP